MFMTNIDTQDVSLAMEAAGHDFQVEKQALLTDMGVNIPDHMAVVNVDTQQYLGTVGSGWEPVQPSTIYDLADELIQSTNGKIVGAFNMFNGAIIGISFELAQREYIIGDPTSLKFIMITSFNGTHGIAGHATTHRSLVDTSCNTSNHVYNMKHTRNVMNRIEVVKNMLKFYNNEIAAFDEKMGQLVGKRMNDTEAIEWFKSLFPKPKTNRSERTLEAQVSIFIDLLHNSPTSNVTGVRGTSYGAFQALTEYINHHRSIRIHNNRDEDEVRFQAVHFGSGNTLSQKALTTIVADDFKGGFSEDDFMIK